MGKPVPIGPKSRTDMDRCAAVRVRAGVEYNARSHTLKLISAMASELPKPRRLPGSVVVVSADTADQAVAEEAKVLADYLGAYTYRVSDVGASNVARLLSQQEALQAADVAIVVCGTDCSLPSLVAGIIQAPVVREGGGIEACNLLVTNSVNDTCAWAAVVDAFLGCAAALAWCPPERHLRCCRGLPLLAGCGAHERRRWRSARRPDAAHGRHQRQLHGGQH